MVKKGEEKSGIIKRADAGAAAKACNVLVKSNYSGSKCMEIKASYVQARRFIDFHTLILNSYSEKI